MYVPPVCASVGLDVDGIVVVDDHGPVGGVGVGDVVGPAASDTVMVAKGLGNDFGTHALEMSAL